MKNEKPLAITYYTKQSVICPVCKKPFPREELLSGGGRLIAGGLTDELRRTYEPSSKYGTIYPLIYSVGVCSSCNAAMFWNDMTSFNDPKTADELYCSSGERMEIVKYALDNNNDYKGAADKFSVPYANVYNWVKMYNEQSEEGLKSHRGRPKNTITELTELEKKDIEIEQLKRELEKHKRAEEILKKNLEIRKQLFKDSHK